MMHWKRSAAAVATAMAATLWEHQEIRPRKPVIARPGPRRREQPRESDMPQVHDVSELVSPSMNAGLLRDLLDLTAHRDRVAFAALHDWLAPPVHAVAARSLPDGDHARAVVQATLLEVWHLAGLASDYRDVWAWVTVITERRAAERVCLIASGYATYTYHDLQTAHDLGRLLDEDG
jgi:hypothetical protein